jgi:hypothetical protein
VVSVAVEDLLETQEADLLLVEDILVEEEEQELVVQLRVQEFSRELHQLR